MTTVVTGWRDFGSALLSTVVPEAWPPLADPQADAAAGADGAWTVRPNVVITSQTSTATIREVGAQVLAESAGIRLPVQLLSADVWTLAGAPGRRIEFVYETPDAAVLVTVWVFATGRHRVELTATRDLADAARLEPFVSAIGSRIVVHEPGMDPVPPEVLASEPVATLETFPATAGVPLPTRPGYDLSVAERDLLLSSRGRGIQAGRTRTPAGATLREAGLLTRFGGTTPEAEALLQPLDGVRTVVQRRSSTGRATRVHREHGDGVLVDRWAGEDEAALSSAPHRLELLDAGRGAADLLRWYGIRPAWPIGDPEEVPLRREDVERRVLQGVLPPPADLGPALQRAWAAPDWVELTATFGRTGRAWRVVRAGDTGWFQVVPAGDDLVHLLPLPTANLVLALLSGGVE